MLGSQRTDLWVVHLDMDAFFASVEQRDNPRLRGKPVIVGGSPASRGVVSTCSYEARKFGVHSAMPSREARRLCPQGIFIQPNFEKYVTASRHIRQIMHRHSDLVEPMSLDEAYLDVTGQDAIAVGRKMKEEIRQELRLTSSVGVSYCKFLAKVGSDLEKPDGLTVITRERAQELLPGFPVRKLHGVGPATEAALKALGIITCGDILRHDPDLLRGHLGRRADELILLAHGVDPRPVEIRDETKSIGEETTFAQDQTNREYLAKVLDQFAASVTADMRRQSLACRTVTVKVKWNVFIEGGPKGGDFQQITRSQTLPAPVTEAADVARVAREIFARVDWEGRKVRLLGLSLHNFVHPGDLVQSRLPV